MKIKILSWNVRGVNDSDKRKVIKNLIRTNRVDLVCLQETKVQEMNIDMVRSLRVGHFLDWTAMNAEGSGGVSYCFGIKYVLAWWTPWLAVFQSHVCSKWLMMDFYGPLQGCMVQL